MSACHTVINGNLNVGGVCRTRKAQETRVKMRKETRNTPIKKKKNARFFNVFNLSVRAVVLPRLMRVNFQQHCLRTASESFKGHRNRKRSEREQTREVERSAAAA